MTKCDPKGKRVVWTNITISQCWRKLSLSLFSPYRIRLHDNCFLNRVWHRSFLETFSIFRHGLSTGHAKNVTRFLSSRSALVSGEREEINSKSIFISLCCAVSSFIQLNRWKRFRKWLYLRVNTLLNNLGKLRHRQLIIVNTTKATTMLNKEFECSFSHRFVLGPFYVPSDSKLLLKRNLRQRKIALTFNCSHLFRTKAC